ncbi:hypothetical protein DGMP_07510 [Desulfomarina profundi]|uniref:Glycosyl transferase family 1 domain-containing protein n=1 Tax=Desulfomarina profundi TaxID=2772557 RepID=A0A8D5FEX5_9BACT|nr:glycosyltransferase family 4 protein [Desulfomarina profundi]BCL60058.1 hypothetical protein DGMP_07510 [Desulfomarina profundi]
MLDALRDIFNAFVKIDLFMSYTFAKADKIYVKTPESKRIIPKKFWPKTKVLLEIGIEKNKCYISSMQPLNEAMPFRVLFVGRFIYWKGMHLGIRAFAHLVEKVPCARLTMVGKGSDAGRWRNLSKKIGVDAHVEWIPWMPQDELLQVYSQHDVFLFPSLHDSSGNVVLEAMAHGLPVVCLDLGGPGVMVNETCGRVVETKGMSERKVSQALGDALVELSFDSELYSDLKKGALMRSKEYLWCHVVGRAVKNL